MKESFQVFKESLIGKLVAATKASKFLLAQEVTFMRTDSVLAKELEGTADLARESINTLAALVSNYGAGNSNSALSAGSASASGMGSGSSNVPGGKNSTSSSTVKPLILFDGMEVGIEENYSKAIDLMDDIYEKADELMQAVVNKGKVTSLSSSTAQAAIALASQQQQKKGEPKRVSSVMLKPQLKFLDKPDNSNSTWMPIITKKPNAQRPLETITRKSLSPSSSFAPGISQEMLTHLQEIGESKLIFPHPYQYEIENIKYPSRLFEIIEEIPYLDINKTKYTWIDTEASLKSLCKTLSLVKEFAVDLEHHDYRSFQGFTCLIQISTRKEDFIIDAIKLRHAIHLLNDSFTNPAITKVFHGAEMDMQWLQRDFGVYVVNLFDTYHASHGLELEKHSFAYLLNYYCEIMTDKSYQLADWRTRPLTDAMIHYAKTDTHYLLYIFDMMRNQLLVASKVERKNEDGTTSPPVDLMTEVLNNSAQTSLRRYEKVIYDASGGEGNGGWKNMLRGSNESLNEQNMAVFKALHAWRDHIARKEDESTAYVLPKHMLFKLARFMPKSSKEVIEGLFPATTLVRIHSNAIASLIANAILEAENNQLMAVDEAPVPVPVPASTVPVKSPVVQKTSFVKSRRNFSVVLPLSTSSLLFGDLLATKIHPTCFAKANAIKQALMPKEHSFVNPPLQVKSKSDAVVVIEKKRKVVEEVVELEHIPVVVEEDKSIVMKKRTIHEGFQSYNYAGAEDPLKLVPHPNDESFTAALQESKSKKVKGNRSSKPKSMNFK